MVAKSKCYVTKYTSWPCFCVYIIKRALEQKQHLRLKRKQKEKLHTREREVRSIQLIRMSFFRKPTGKKQNPRTINHWWWWGLASPPG